MDRVQSQTSFSKKETQPHTLHTQTFFKRGSNYLCECARNLSECGPVDPGRNMTLGTTFF